MYEIPASAGMTIMLWLVAYSLQLAAYIYLFFYHRIMKKLFSTLCILVYLGISFFPLMSFAAK